MPRPNCEHEGTYYYSTVPYFFQEKMPPKSDGSLAPSFRLLLGLILFWCLRVPLLPFAATLEDFLAHLRTPSHPPLLYPLP